MGATLPNSGGGGRGRRARRGGRQPMAEINVTPFVDVMLVLLIIFMVSAPLLTPGVSVDLPRVSEAKTLPRPKAKPVAVTVAADGALYFGKDKLGFEDLLKRLEEEKTASGSDQVYLRGAGGVEYETVAKIIVRLANAGFANIAFITADKNASARLSDDDAETVDLDKKTSDGAAGSSTKEE